jgi:hypothetical protein
MMVPFSHPHYRPIQAAKRKLLEERADLRAQTQYMVPTYEELTERYPCPLPTLACFLAGDDEPHHPSGSRMETTLWL